MSYTWNTTTVCADPPALLTVTVNAMLFATDPTLPLIVPSLVLKLSESLSNDSDGLIEYVSGAVPTTVGHSVPTDDVTANSPLKL